MHGACVRDPRHRPEAPGLVEGTMDLQSSRGLADDIVAADDFAEFAAQAVIFLAFFCMRTKVSLVPGYTKRLLSAIGRAGCPPSTTDFHV